MLICLLLFSLWSHAEDFSSERYCFANTREALSAENKFLGIKVSSDTLTRDGNCFTVQMAPHRRELIQRFIMASSPSVQVAFSSAEIKRDPCKLKVEKERTELVSNNNVSLDQSPNIEAVTKQSSTKETFLIQTLKEFELTVNQDQIKGECRYITPTRYEVSLEVRKNPRPIYPESLPPGPVVMLNEMPQNQKTSVLRTVIQLHQGDRIDLGSVVQKLKDDSHSADVKPELKVEADSQNIAEKVFLGLE